MPFGETAETTPEVPMEIATSPVDMPRPRAAAALSPAPGPSAVPPQPREASAVPTCSRGPATLGRTIRCASSSERRSAWASRS